MKSEIEAAGSANGVSVAGGVLPCALLVAPEFTVTPQPGRDAEIALKWVPLTVNPAMTSWFVHNIYAQVELRF